MTSERLEATGQKKYPGEYTAPVILSKLLQDKGVWTPIKYENIEDKSKIIRSLLFLKRKRDGTLKARLVVVGCMQDRSTSQDNSSPTFGTESLFLIAAIFAAENRHVVTVDIEGAFLHGVMTNEVYMKIHGQCVDIYLSVVI